MELNLNENMPSDQNKSHSDHNTATEDNSSPETEASSVKSEQEQKCLVLETQLKEKEEKYLYLYAEFENFKKRILKEQREALRFGCEPLARAILTPIDNLQRSLDHVPKDFDQNFVSGIKMILTEFESILEKQGIVSIKSLHEPFDPHTQEAMGYEESDLLPGMVIKENQRGYKLHEKLLRPASVMVSRGKE